MKALKQTDILDNKIAALKIKRANEFVELKEQYFNLLATDLKLLKLYEKDNENLKEEEQEFKPM